MKLLTDVEGAVNTAAGLLEQIHIANTGCTSILSGLGVTGAITATASVSAGRFYGTANGSASNPTFAMQSGHLASGFYQTGGTGPDQRLQVTVANSHIIDLHSSIITLNRATTIGQGNLVVAGGQIKVGGGAPGLGKVLTSDANGLATWETLGGSSFTLIGSVGEVTAPTYSFAGFTNTGVFKSESVGGGDGVGIAAEGSEVATFADDEIYFDVATTFDKQIKIAGGAPEVGKVLTSDADGLATWETVASGSGAWEKVGEFTVTTETNPNETPHMTVSGLNLIGDGGTYRVIIRGGFLGGNAPYAGMWFNTDTGLSASLARYAWLYLDQWGVNQERAANNDAAYGQLASALCDGITSDVIISHTPHPTGNAGNGMFTATHSTNIVETLSPTTGPELITGAFSWKNPEANITAITVGCALDAPGAGDSFTVGSKITVLKLV